MQTAEAAAMMTTHSARAAAFKRYQAACRAASVARLVWYDNGTAENKAAADAAHAEVDAAHAAWRAAATADNAALAAYLRATNP